MDHAIENYILLHKSKWQKWLSSTSDEPVLFLSESIECPKPVLIYSDPQNEEIDAVILECLLSKHAHPRWEYKKTYQGIRISDKKSIIVIIALFIPLQARYSADIEAEMLEKLSGVPGIVETELIFKCKRMNVFLQKFYKGGNLRNRIDKKVLKIMDKIFIFYHLLESLFYIHSLGYLYTDFNLSNIIFGQNSLIPILCDFGSACLIHDIHNRKKIHITNMTSYAPEFLKCHMEKKPYCYTVESDIWGIGNLIYECLFERDPPWKPYLMGKVRYRQAYNCILNPENFPEPGNPFSPEHLCWRMLRSDPHQRISIKDSLDMAKGILGSDFIR